MSQAIQVIPSVSPLATPGAAANNAPESPESGQSFQSALAGQMTNTEAPTAEAPATGNAPTDPLPDSAAAPITNLAAHGNTLPPQLPPLPVDLAALATVGTEVEAGPLAETGDLPVTAITDDQKDSLPVAEAVADSSVAASVLFTMPIALPAPVVVPSGHGQFRGAPVAPSDAANHPALAMAATRGNPAEAQTLAALTAEASGQTASTKTADLAPSLEVFRTVLKETIPAASDARPALTSLLPVSAAPTASSFASPVASNPAAAMASSTIGVPFGHAEWGQAFGNQVVWAVNQGMPGAELHLSPPDLGPMSVRISMDQDQASMAFSSPHAMVRDAIESALPRLRDMLGSQGITLADVNVSQHGAAHSQRDPGEWWSISPRGTGGSDPGPVIGAVPTRTSVGMLDIYV
jgi:flagellar hook-length control protein FliK